MNDKTPSAGVRILLELASFDEVAAQYQAAIFTPAARFDYRLAIASSDGAVTLAEVPQNEGQSFAELVRLMARSLARDALATTPLRWPRRLLRWRDK